MEIGQEVRVSQKCADRSFRGIEGVIEGIDGDLFLVRLETDDYTLPFEADELDPMASEDAQ